MKIRNSHKIIYTGNPNYIHSINIIHKHGTCLEAGAFRELKILMYKWTKFMTSSIANMSIDSA